MAEVDFSNATIEPATTLAGMTMYNPTRNEKLSLTAYGGKLFNSNGVEIGTGTLTLLVNELKQFVYQFRGTFSAGGTEAYIVGNDAAWRIYNISFSNGDTYSFTINATLTCN